MASWEAIAHQAALAWFIPRLAACEAATPNVPRPPKPAAALDEGVGLSPEADPVGDA